MSEPRSRALDRVIGRLPQRPPFLFVDEIVSLEPLVSAVGAVVFRSGHRIFENHFPGRPIVPGVIVIEALTQLSGIVAAPEAADASGPAEGAAVIGYLAGVDRMRFRRLVGPDERLVLRTRLVRRFGSAAGFDVSADVGGEEVAAGSITIGGMS